MTGTDVPMMNVFHFTLRGLADQVLRGTSGYLPSKYVSSVFEKLASVGKKNVAVSSKVARELWSLYRIRSRVIELGVDMERFKPLLKERSRELIGLDTDKTVGLFVGRADDTKGFDILKEMQRKRPDVQFLCVTSSDLADEGLIVHRNVANERMPLYYSSADFLLFPSRYESVGYTGLEAMACDLPVVVSRTGVFEDLEESGIGRIVPTWKASDYASAVDDVLSRPFHPRRAIRERYSMERFIRDYRAAAEEAVGSGG
jgi:glycosyltransferase involved in cell wall biosynthesis